MFSPLNLRSCARCTSFLRTQLIAAQSTRCITQDPNDIEIPPEPTTCCMSGCANCVWIEYALSLSKLFEHNDERATNIVLSKITDPNLKAFLSIELRYLNVLREKEASNEEGAKK